MFALRTIVLVGLCGVLAIGCGKEEGTKPTTPVPGGGAAAGAKTAEEIGSGLGETAEKVGEAAKAALEEFRAEYARQLDTHESQLSALRASAKAFSDEKLTGLIGDLDGKLAAARTKLGQLSAADIGTTAALKQELTGLMNEIPKLYEQAMARFNELKGSGLPDMPGMPGR